MMMIHLFKPQFRICTPRRRYLYAKTGDACCSIVVVTRRNWLLFYYCLKNIMFTHHSSSLFVVLWYHLPSWRWISCLHVRVLLSGSPTLANRGHGFVFKICTSIYTFLFHVLAYKHISFTALVYSSIQSTTLSCVAKPAARLPTAVFLPCIITPRSPWRNPRLRLSKGLQNPLIPM